MAKCPYCDTRVTNLNVEPVDLTSGARRFRGNAYVCPRMGCGKIVSVEMDPIALNSDLVNDIQRR